MLVRKQNSPKKGAVNAVSRAVASVNKEMLVPVVVASMLVPVL